MISRDLIDVLNSGDAVAILGSGVSSDAGLPNWDELYSAIALELRAESHQTKDADKIFARGQIPEAFDLLPERTSLEQRVRRLMERATTPGKHHKRLADWPFRFFVTTNYDHLLEDASGGRLVAVGNSGSEVPKMRGGPSGVVWHIHGGTRLDAHKSRLVVSKRDYDEIYPTSNIVETLSAIAMTSRLVFFGFGFKERDLVRILDFLGRLASPARPSYAFIGCGEEEKGFQQRVNEFRSRYNIDIRPYVIRDKDHSELHRILDGYAPFVLRRSITGGKRPSGTPVYDSKTVSLRVVSSLDLGALAASDAGLRQRLVAARVLAGIRGSAGISEDELLMMLGGPCGKTVVQECIAQLRQRGHVGPGPRLTLTAAYQDSARSIESVFELARDKFLASLTARLRGGSGGRPVDETVVVGVLSSFLESLCRENGLGVAQNLVSQNASQSSRRAVALLQELPDRLGACRDRADALAAIAAATGVLTCPTEQESHFLGMLCQCYFGQHLIGASAQISAIDIDHVSDSLFILDATVIICLLAEGGLNFGFIFNLVRDLKAVGAKPVTTDLLVDEVVEHANWALRLVGLAGDKSPQVLDALRGKSGFRPNAFLSAYHMGEARDPSFSAFVGRVLGARGATTLTSAVVKRTLESHGIAVMGFSDWGGFDQSLFAERDNLQAEIDSRRQERGTYKHGRQTKAEAEVALVIDRVRDGTLSMRGAPVKDAFFVSSTRIIDGLPQLQRRLTLLPEGLGQWLWNCQNADPQHAGLVFEQLLWDIAQAGAAFIDATTLRNRFSGVVEAATEEFESLVGEHKECLIDRFGPDPLRAFNDADPLDRPWLTMQGRQEVLNRMQKSVAEAHEEAAAAKASAKMADRDRVELAKLRARKDEKRKKAQKKQRAAQSAKGKKGGGRKR